MRWLFIFFVCLLTGCATGIVSSKHEAPIEVYVVMSKSDWQRLLHISLDSGDLTTISEVGFRCTHELKRDLHQCFYLSNQSLQDTCLRVQDALKHKLDGQLTQPLSLRYSRCSVDPSEMNKTFVDLAAIVFESRIRFELTYKRVHYGTLCASGKVSRSTGRGTCSWNGGVAGTAYGWILDGEVSNKLMSAYSNSSRFTKQSK